MDLGNLMSFSDHVIGIENDFVKDDSSDMPAGVGECYSLPTEYVKICLEGLNVADDEYMELVQEYTNAVDFTKAGFPTLTSEPALYIHTNSQEGLVLHQSLLVWSNGTALDRYTNKIWIYAPGINAEYRIFYEDSSGDIQYAGNLTGGSRITTKFAHLNYGSLGSSVNLNFLGRRPSSSQSFFNITLTSPLLDNITSIFSTSNGKVNALGALQSWEEPSELVWDDRVNIGTKDEDHRTRYGIIIRDPKTHGASDEVVLEIPNRQVKARVSIALTATSPSQPAKTVTCTFGNNCFLNQGDTAEISGNKIKLMDVGSTGDIILDVEQVGKSTQIVRANRTLNFDAVLKISNKETYYDFQGKSSATIVVTVL